MWSHWLYRRSWPNPVGRSTQSPPEPPDPLPEPGLSDGEPSPDPLPDPPEPEPPRSCSCEESFSPPPPCWRLTPVPSSCRGPSPPVREPPLSPATGGGVRVGSEEACGGSRPPRMPRICWAMAAGIGVRAGGTSEAIEASRRETSAPSERAALRFETRARANPGPAATGPARKASSRSCNRASAMRRCRVPELGANARATRSIVSRTGYRLEPGTACLAIAVKSSTAAATAAAIRSGHRARVARSRTGRMARACWSCSLGRRFRHIPSSSTVGVAIP
jgi:hypothetical protein